MEITGGTKVSAILRDYGDIAEVMETFGIKRVRGSGVRRVVAEAHDGEAGCEDSPDTARRVPGDPSLGGRPATFAVTAWFRMRLPATMWRRGSWRSSTWTLSRSIERTDGKLIDHFDSDARTLRLSPEVAGGARSRRWLSLRTRRHACPDADGGTLFRARGRSVGRLSGLGQRLGRILFSVVGAAIAKG